MSDKQERILAAAKLWAAAAWSDGVISDEEKMGMAAILKVAELDEEQRQEALSWLENKVDIADLDPGNIPDDRKRAIYKAAAAITAMDNKVVVPEKVFLSRLQSALGIDNATARELHAEIPGME